MKIKNKLTAGALFLGALFAITGPLISVYIASADVAPGAPVTTAATGNVVPDVYNWSTNKDEADRSSYQCSATIHKATDLGDKTSPTGKLAVAATQLGYAPTAGGKPITTMLNSVQGAANDTGFQATFGDVAGDTPVLYIDFSSSQGSNQQQGCGMALYLFRQASTTSYTQFDGFWSTGQFPNAGTNDQRLLVSVIASIDLTSKTVAFALPSGYTKQIRGTNTPPDGNFSLKLADPDKILVANGQYFGGSASGGGSTTPIGTAPEINCSVQWYNPLSWFLCPLASALETVVSNLDNEINNFMDIKAGKGSYDTTNCGTSDPWCSYYKPWSVFRDISLALTVVFALIAILSQAFGLEIFDAYTLRKVLPRLLIAIIGITLSWPLMMFFINLVDALGLGIRGLIYAPFNAGGFNKVALGGGGQFISSLFLGGAIVGLGFAGLLSFVATAALAVSLAFLVLILRQMVVTMLVIFAPIAIVCYTLPNTQKVWKLWWESFSRGLLMFPLIAGFIAIGRVFAAVNSQNTGSINQIIAFTAYFAPYFLIPFTFRLAGGAIATLGGLVNDRGRGAFDRLKKFRAGESARNMADLKAGSRWNSNSRATQLLGGSMVNRVGAHAGAGMRGRFGFGVTGATARANNALLTADGAAKESRAFAAQMNNEGAMAALAFGNNETRLRQLRHYRNYDANGNFNGTFKEDLLQGDMAAARSIGVDQRMQIAGADALAKSGKVLTSREEANSLYDELSKGNDVLRGNIKGNYQYTSRTVGRADIGRNSAYDSFKELDMGTVGRLKPIAAANLFGTDPTTGQSQFNTALTEAARAGANPEEIQHMFDVLYASQFNSYTSPEQQGAISQTLTSMSNDPRMLQAQQNYGAKYSRNQQQGGTQTPGEVAGGPPGSPPS